MKTYKFGDNIQVLYDSEWAEAKFLYYSLGLHAVYINDNIYHIKEDDIRPSSKPNPGDEVYVRDKGDKEWYPKETYIGEYGVGWVSYDGYNLWFWDEVKKVEDEQPTELTLDQIEEKLGMKIKIINPIK